MGELFYKVYELVKLIPKGKVTTYGEIAKAMGNPHFSQRVGHALHQNKNPIIVPCHRVVNRFGELASGFKFGGAQEQKYLLEREGVNVELIEGKFKVDLNKYMFHYTNH